MGQGSYPRRGSDRPSQCPTISTVRAVGAGGEHLQPPSCEGKSLMGDKDGAGVREGLVHVDPTPAPEAPGGPTPLLLTCSPKPLHPLAMPPSTQDTLGCPQLLTGACLPKAPQPQVPLNRAAGTIPEAIKLVIYMVPEPVPGSYILQVISRLVTYGGHYSKTERGRPAQGHSGTGVVGSVGLTASSCYLLESLFQVTGIEEGRSWMEVIKRSKYVTLFESFCASVS